MRAVVDPIDMSSLLFECGLHPRMDIQELFFLDETASDPGLVGDNDRQKTGLIELAYGFEAVGIDLDLIVGIRVADITVDISISIEKNGTIFHGNIPWPRSKTSSAEMFSMQRWSNGQSR